MQNVTQLDCFAIYTNHNLSTDTTVRQNKLAVGFPERNSLTISTKELLEKPKLFGTVSVQAAMHRVPWVVDVDILLLLKLAMRTTGLNGILQRSFVRATILPWPKIEPVGKTPWMETRIIVTTPVDLTKLADFKVEITYTHELGIHLQDRFQRMLQSIGHFTIDRYDSNSGDFIGNFPVNSLQHQLLLIP